MLEAGPYTAYEIAPPLQYQFLDDDGVAINLTGYTVKFHYLRHGSAAVTRNATLTTPLSGIVTYQWIAADLNTAGVYKAQFEVGNLTNRYYSEDIAYRVRTAVAAGTT